MSLLIEMLVVFVASVTGVLTATLIAYELFKRRVSSRLGPLWQLDRATEYDHDATPDSGNRFELGGSSIDHDDEPHDT